MIQKSQLAQSEIFLQFQEEVEKISDQLCVAVTEQFDFSVITPSKNETVQKLAMMINFILDANRRALGSIQEKNARLTELDQLKSDFITNVSHELRTPLTLILGPLEIIIGNSDAALSGDLRAHLERMLRNASRLYKLVNDLLDFSKLESGKFETHEELFDPNQVVGQIVDDAHGLSQNQKITLNFIKCETLQEIKLDLTMFEKIIINLLGNALKFTDAGGKIDVSLEEKPQTFILRVSDTGRGIPAAKIPKLFERFYQVDSSSTRAHEGTGIGLAIVKQYVDLMHGNIDVTSEVGKGTCFTIELPKVYVASNEKTVIEPLEKTLNSEIKTIQVSPFQFEQSTNSLNQVQNPINSTEDSELILIADDNADMRSYLISLLKDSYRVVALENGKKVIDALNTYTPDLIITDVMMPEMDGLHLTKILKSDPKTQHIPIILVTAKVGKEAVLSGFDVGADDFLPKPFSPEELMARTKSMLKLHRNYQTEIKMNYQLNSLVTDLRTTQEKIENTNRSLTEEVAERKKAQENAKILNEKLVVAARLAGKAEVSTSVIHNIGNVLNSIGVSNAVIHEKILQSKISDLGKLGKFLEENQHHFEKFIAENKQGKHLIPYINSLASIWEEEKVFFDTELSSIRKSVDHIKDIINLQQTFGGTLGLLENTNIYQIIDDAVKLTQNTIGTKSIATIIHCPEDLNVVTDKNKLLQVLVNLLQNAYESTLEKNPPNKKIEVRVCVKDKKNIHIEVVDNGVGISKENEVKIFSQGFTTKKKGHGFGLHSSALLIKELGGNIIAQSEGVGEGALFTVILPLAIKS